MSQSLEGHQLNILKTLCDKSLTIKNDQNEEIYITSQINTIHLANILDIDKDIIKTSLQRLIFKGHISNYESKKGRTGWTKYNIPLESFELVRNSYPILSHTEKLLKSMQEENQILKDNDKKRKLEISQVKDELNIVKKKIKNMEADNKHRDKYFGSNLPLSLSSDIKVDHLNWDKLHLNSFEEPIYAFIEGPFEIFKSHAIDVIDFHLKEETIEGFKIGMTNNTMTRLKSGYSMCKYLVVVYRTDHQNKAGKMETELIEYYKDHPKLRNKAPGNEGRKAQDKGPYYTYVAFS